MSERIRYDFEPEGATGRAPYRNNPGRWLLQARERESWTRVDYRGVRSRQTHWTRWRTGLRCLTSGEAFDALDARCVSGLAQWRVARCGKAISRAALAPKSEAL